MSVDRVGFDDPITTEEAEAAAKSLGLTMFRGNKAAALRKLGLHHAQHGVVFQGLGRLAIAEDALQRIMTKAVEIAESAEDGEVAVAAIHAARGVADSMLNNTRYQIELQQEKLIPAADSSNKKKIASFDRPIVLAVNIDNKPTEPKSITSDGQQV